MPQHGMSQERCHERAGSSPRNHHSHRTHTRCPPNCIPNPDRWSEQTCPSLYKPAGPTFSCLWCNGGVDRAELVGRLFLAYQSRNLEELGGLVAPDVHVEPLSTALLPGHAYLGLDGITSWLDELADSGYEYHPDIDAMEVHGDRVLVAGTV